MPKWERLRVQKGKRPKDAESKRWPLKALKSLGFKENLHLSDENTWASS